MISETKQDRDSEYRHKIFPEWMRDLKGELRFNDKLRQFANITQLAIGYLKIISK